MLFETDVVLLLGAGEVLADDPKKLGLEVLHLAGREFRPVIGEHELEAFLDVILAAAPTEETEHQRPPKIGRASCRERAQVTGGAGAASDEQASATMEHPMGRHRAP